MKKLTSLSVQAALAGGLCLLLAHDRAMASGFSLPEVSAAGIGLSNALVANPDEPGAFAYNPAAMGFHDNSSLALGGYAINPNFSVDTASGSFDSDAPQWIGAPMIQGAAKVHDKWRIGLAVNAPFGLETRWEEGTFPALSGKQLRPVPPTGRLVPFPKGDHPTQSKLKIVSLVPTVAYQVNDNLSVAAGLDYYDVRETALDTQNSTLDGTGDGWGWNLSFLYADGPWSVGAVYRATATANLHGSVRITDPVLARLLPAYQSAEVDLDLPWRFQLGVRYEVNTQVAVELDWSRTGWSEFDTLEIKNGRTGAPIRTTTNALDDANAYRIGLTYEILPTTQLRLGYSYDETGQGDDHFSARIADSDRHLFSIGAAHDPGQGWAVEGGYMYVRFKDRSYSSSKPYGGLGTDENGTDAINGDYSANAHLVGIEVRKTF